MTEKPRKLRFGLIVDHPTRDLAGMVLVAHHLVKLGFEACLIPMYQQGVDVPLLDLDALVVNFARPVNLELVKEYAAIGISVFVLDTEGGVLSTEGRASAPEIVNYIKSSGFTDVLSGYFFWGEQLYKAFADSEVLDKNRLFLTGCPRFDFYAERLRTAEPTRRQDHILVNTNYPMANPRFLTGRTNDADALASLGFSSAYIKKLIAENQRIMNSMIDLVLVIAKDFPEKKIILRPHPFENAEHYMEFFSNIPNITVDAKGPVLEALKGAVAMIHLNCGTAIEALMTGVPPLTPEWLNSDFMRRHAELPTRASLSVTSYPELFEKIRTGRQAFQADLRKLYKEVAEPFFFHNDGQAGKRVAEQLAAIVEHNQPKRRINLRTSLRGSHKTPSIGQKIQAAIANVVGSAIVRDLRTLLSVARRAKVFNITDVQKILDFLTRVEGGSAAKAVVARHPFTCVPMATINIRRADNV